MLKVSEVFPNIRFPAAGVIGILNHLTYGQEPKSGLLQEQYAPNQAISPVPLVKNNFSLCYFCIGDFITNNYANELSSMFSTLAYCLKLSFTGKMGRMG